MRGPTGTAPPAAGSKGVPPESRLRRMFDEIVPGYDLLNDVLSAGMDRWWRRAAVRALDALPATPVLDLGCGTGRLSERLARGDRAFGVGERGAERLGRGGGPEAVPSRSPGVPFVVGIDVSSAMLEAGRRRSPQLVEFVQGSVFRLPFRDGVFGGAVSAFVLRNLDDLPTAFNEMTRVLLPGAGVALLDITEPANPLRRRVFDAYFRIAAPAVGGLVGRRRAYRYLVRSLAHLPPPAEVGRLLADAGCDRVRWRSLAPGMITLWRARRV